MPATISVSVKSSSPVSQWTKNWLRAEGTSVDVLKSWQQGIADRVIVLGKRFRREAAVDQSLVDDDDIDVAQMQAAFAQLPAPYQEILLLQVRSGRSPAQIASQLKLTVPRVLTRLRRARQELRRRLGEDLSMDPTV